MPSRFQVGDTVQVKVRGPEGYNRTPIYLRGKTGVIHSIHGEFVNARGLGYGKAEDHQTLYAISFNLAYVRGRDPESSRDTLIVDVLEEWLETPGETPVRRHIEKDVHQMDYYEHRAAALSSLLVQKGILALDEVRRYVQDADYPKFEAASALLYSPSSQEPRSDRGQEEAPSDN